MKLLYKLISQLLIVSMILLPFSTQAGMIGTDQVVAGVTAQANRDKVLDFVSRSDVARQLETLGLSTANAQERVNAMTQEELNRIAGKIDSLPAGATDSGTWWAIGVVVVALFIWLVWYRK